MSMRNDDFYMHRALDEAHRALGVGEVPVGAVVVDRDGEIIGRGYNQPIATHDPSAHAEIMAMRSAAEHRSNYRLEECSLYVTLEPCMMCLGAIIHARLKRVVYGAAEPRTGMVESCANLAAQPWHAHRPELTGGVQAGRCQRLLKRFFSERRQASQADSSEAEERAAGSPFSAAGNPPKSTP